MRVSDVSQKNSEAQFVIITCLFSGINAQVSYRLVPNNSGGSSGDNEFFHINANDGTLVLSRSLDRETQSHHHLLVMASDEGNPSLSSTAHIWIRGALLFTYCCKLIMAHSLKQTFDAFQWRTLTTTRLALNSARTVACSVKTSNEASSSRWSRPPIPTFRIRRSLFIR